jgi:predicted  nucleic acid-binding Zn-ribbon protein
MSKEHMEMIGNIEVLPCIIEGRCLNCGTFFEKNTDNYSKIIWECPTCGNCVDDDGKGVPKLEYEKISIREKYLKRKTFSKEPSEPAENITKMIMETSDV